MSGAHAHDQTVPRPALIAAGAIVGLTLLLTLLVRVGVLEREAVPAVARHQDSAVVAQQRRLVFRDAADGAVVIVDADSGRTVTRIESETKSGGFVRGVMRGIARDRRSRGIGAAPPFTLTLWSDGGLTLVDSATGRSTELGGFGPDNRAVFAALLPGRGG